MFQFGFSRFGAYKSAIEIKSKISVRNIIKPKSNWIKTELKFWLQFSWFEAVSRFCAHPYGLMRYTSVLLGPIWFTLVLFGLLRSNSVQFGYIQSILFCSVYFSTMSICVHFRQLDQNLLKYIYRFQTCNI